MGGRLKVHSIEVRDFLKVKGPVTFEDTLTFGNANVDTLILKGRVATGTAAGSNISIDATYINTYQQLQEEKCQITAWGSQTSFSGWYFRAENGVAGGGKGLRTLEIYAVDNATFSIDNLQAAYFEAAMKASGTQTIKNANAAEFALAPYGGTGAITITNHWECVLLTPSGVSSRIDGTNAAKIHGIYMLARDGDGGSTRLGYGFYMANDSAQSGTRSLTAGIYVNIGCGTMFSASATAAAASTRGIFIGEDSDSAQSAIPLLGAAWATAQGNAIYCDDDGVALVGYTEALTVRMLTTAAVATGDVSTVAIHPDLTLNANYTGSGGLSSIWGNTTIKASKTIDTSAGLGDVGGGTFGLDVAGTLAANTHGCGVSVGLGGSGTKNGITTGFRIRTPTGTVLWDGIMSVPSDGTTLAAMTTTGSNTATMTNSPHTGDPSYWFNFYVGTTKLCMPVWAST